ncbi:hypothetical protein ECB98_24715 [Brucellaceae bacterium VT-16-1752]|nr:hypothetical protein ECB98_24715 [Brucellaceae bacterium VT-16-1752]
MALARGASRVVAIGRNDGAALERLPKLDDHVATIQLSGDLEEDARKILAVASPQSLSTIGNAV